MPLPSLPELLIGGLAVWRLSALIAYERGPFAIFQRIRTVVGIDHFDDGTPDPVSVRGELSKLVSCVWCLSIYISFAWFIGFGLAFEWIMPISFVLALSSLAIFGEQINHK